MQILHIQKGELSDGLHASRLEGQVYLRNVAQCHVSDVTQPLWSLYFQLFEVSTF